MSSTLARPLLRRSPLNTLRTNVARRFESTNAAGSTTAQKTAETAKNTASEYASKASQGLTRVTSAAGPAIAGAAKGVSSALGKVGGRTGKFIGFVERQVPLVVYYSKVGIELAKLVFQGQKMQPPSLSTFQSYFNRALSTVKNPSALLQATPSAAATPASALQQARNISRAQIVGGGVLLAEVLGFFTVGEMIGRFKLVGYHGETAHHH